MEKQYGKIVKILGLIFAIVAIFHIFYASCSQRGLYFNGSVFLLQMLDNISNGSFEFYTFPFHTNYIVNVVQELPVLFLGVILYVKDKILLANVFSLIQFLIPLLFIWWNCVLTKRTKQYAVLFWSVFVYSAVILQYAMFSLSVTLIGVPAQFILLNYMLGKIDYTKADKIGIFFLVLIMFGASEQIILIGLVLFACLFPALYDEDNPKNVSTKIFIGIGSLIASIYCCIFCFTNRGILYGEFIRYFSDMVDFWSHSFGLSMAVAMLSIIIFGLVCLGRKKFTVKLTVGISFLYLYFLLRMIAIPNLYIQPIFERRIETVVYWFVPAIFLGICLYRYLKKDNQFELIKTAYVPTLLCGITLAGWQMVQTYYWNININYMRNEINNCNKILYIPEEHDPKDEISSFCNKNLRRYIFPENYVATALLLASDYDVKHLLINNNDGRSYREKLYADIEHGLISIPYTGHLYSIKNVFWDLTKCAEALEKYNEENNIKIERLY